MSRKVPCPRCDSPFAHRNQALEHAEKQHGDYIHLRTRDEYLALIEETGQGNPELARGITQTAFLSISKLKEWMRAGIAETALYSVRVRKHKAKGLGGRRPQTTCPTCGGKFDPRHGRKYDRDECRPSTYKPIKKPKMPEKGDKPIRGKRRQRCARDGCDLLFFPANRRHQYHDEGCRQKALRALTSNVSRC